MIELNGIYKLKHIKNFEGNTDYNYKVVGMSEDGEIVGCVLLDGVYAGEKYVFQKICLIDPEKPDDIYFGEMIQKKG